MQKILRERSATAIAMQATKRDRSTISRWRRGISYPDRQAAEQLIGAFPGLDYNGCYAPADEEVRG